MFRKLFVPAIAMAMLSGCVTDYSYRDGQGDYYYGRPQVEYRVIGGYGYGGYGGYGDGSGWYGGYGYGSGYGSGYARPVYYYDRFGRLVYGYPYGAYGYGGYGTPYSGGYRQHRPHPPQGGGVPVQPLQPGTDANDNDNDRQPTWRNYRDMRPVAREGDSDPREDNRPRRLPSPFMQPMPRPQRVIAPAASMGAGEPLMGVPSERRTRRVSPVPTAEE